MNLSSELISQFAKITNDKKTKTSEEVTLYGEVYELEETIYVKFDGSEELTPVTTIVEKDETGEIINYKYGAASVKSGDRVSVVLKNHSATITGNLSDPAVGNAKITALANKILLEVTGPGSKFSTLEQTVEGFTFTDEEGAVKIDGGSIDAKNLHLTGSININNKFIVDPEGNATWSAGNSPVQVRYSVDGTGSGWHTSYDPANDFFAQYSYDGGKTWTESIRIRGINGENGKDGVDGKDGKDGEDGRNGSDANVTYANIKRALQNANSIQTTFITADSTGAPNIYGGNIYGGNIYAGDDSDIFCRLSSDGFELYHTDISTPKALMSANSSGSLVQLILGAGTEETSYDRRFYIQKNTTQAGIYFYPANGDMNGFTFQADGTIYVHGTMVGDAPSGGTVTAVWG